MTRKLFTLGGVVGSALMLAASGWGATGPSRDAGDASGAKPLGKRCIHAGAESGSVGQMGQRTVSTPVNIVKITIRPSICVILSHPLPILRISERVF